MKHAHVQSLWRVSARPPEARWPVSGVCRMTIDPVIQAVNIRFQVRNPYQRTPKNEIASSCLRQISLFPAQNALPDSDKERPRNAKERLALKSCPLSGKTAFFGLALWKNRIFKRKNPRPKNARPPRRKPGTCCQIECHTHPLSLYPPDLSRTTPAYSKMQATPILEVSRSTTEEEATEEATCKNGEQ